jgi:predicted ABC-type ATPase
VLGESLNSPQVVIIAGPNGAGKTELAPHLLRDRLGLLEYVNADTIAQGLSAFQPERAAFEAGRIMLKRLRELAGQRKSFAFETTLATRSYAVWIRGLRQDGYRINLMFVSLSSPELAIERVRRRVFSGGHNIPEETIRRRYRKGIKNFLTLYQPLADEWGVFNNSDWNPLSLIASGSGQATQTVFLPGPWAKFQEAANE